MQAVRMRYHARREGVPVWDGDASTYVAYAEAAELYEQTTAYHKRCLAAPRLVAELQGAARKLVVGQPADWLSFNGGVAKLLDHLRQGLGQPKIPELTDHLHRYLCQSRRKHGETINSYVSRKMEIYLRAQQAMKRLQPVHGNKEETPRKSPTWDWSWYSANYSYPGPWWQNYNSSRTPWTREQQARDPITGREDDEDDEGETQTGRRESWQSETTWGGFRLVWGQNLGLLVVALIVRASRRRRLHLGPCGKGAVAGAPPRLCPRVDFTPRQQPGGRRAEPGDHGCCRGLQHSQNYPRAQVTVPRCGNPTTRCFQEAPAELPRVGQRGGRPGNR